MKREFRINRPYALIMTGIPGSGKSFFATKFAELFNAPIISEDELKQTLEESGSKNLGVKQSAAIVDLILNKVLTTKAAFVYDGNVETESERIKLAKKVSEAGLIPLFVWVQTDQASAKRRARKNGIKPEDFERSIKRFVRPSEKRHFVVISGKHTFASQIKVVLSELGKLRDAGPNKMPQSTSRIGSRV